MQGKIISYSSLKKRTKFALEADLVSNIKTLEALYAIKQEEHLWAELYKLKTEFAKFSNKRI